ncbi:NHL domain-containing protein [Streptomyces sp. 1331.2]|uniref:NHL domain-containing protein n=1 Tax=Streptomyces sp. 1331.2 TaxID=1938835 RepID=UPI000BC4BEE8|nr:RICIN domain-containing protein [Streptomyces sp. 1331.2]SOB85294.1 NHL repeat-containing protein [Streptomyces sp. 1331.2]
MSTAPEATTGSESPAPVISTVAGTGVAGPKGDNGSAVRAELNGPFGIAVDSTGTLYFVDRDNHRLRKVTTDGRIGTVAGTGTAGFSGDNGPAAKAQLSYPRGVAVDGAGTLYLTDGENHRIRKITADGTITTIAGTGTAGFSGDNGPAAKAQLNCPTGLVVDSTGTLHFIDRDNHRIRKITADGTITTIAGTDTGTGAAGFSGDNGPADQAQLNRPHGLAMDGTGTLYFTDADNHRIRKITAEGTITTIAGTGTADSTGDGGPADEAQLNCPTGLVVDGTGVLYIAEYNSHRVRKITAEGTITTIAGTGTADSTGDGGPADEAQLNNPLGLALDCVGTLYISEYGGHRIRKVTSPATAGLPESGTVVSWANVRSRLRMGALRESTKDGAEIHQVIAAPREHQRWRLVVAGQQDGEVLYTFENVRSGLVLEVPDGLKVHGTVVAQRAYQGADAHHQQWRLIPIGPATDSPRVFEIANRHSGLLLRVDATTPAAVQQRGADGDHRNRQWQLLPI